MSDISRLCAYKISSLKKRDYQMIRSMLKKSIDDDISKHPAIWNFLYINTSEETYPDLYQKKYRNMKALPEEEVLHFVLGLYSIFGNDSTMALGNSFFNTNAPSITAKYVEQLAKIHDFEQARPLWINLAAALKAKGVPLNYSQLAHDMVKLYWGTTQQRKEVPVAWLRRVNTSAD